MSESRTRTAVEWVVGALVGGSVLLASAGWIYYYFVKGYGV